MSAYSAAHAIADYRQMIVETGEQIVVRRGEVEFTVGARLLKFDSESIDGGKRAVTRTFLIVAADLHAAGFSPPFERNKDRILWNGKVLVVVDADDSTRRVAGTLVAYVVEASGS